MLTLLEKIVFNAAIWQNSLWMHDDTPWSVVLILRPPCAYPVANPTPGLPPKESVGAEIVGIAPAMRE